VATQAQRINELEEQVAALEAEKKKIGALESKVARISEAVEKGHDHAGKRARWIGVVRKRVRPTMASRKESISKRILDGYVEQTVPLRLSLGGVLVEHGAEFVITPEFSDAFKLGDDYELL